ncbi:FAD:protein FMN transferase [Phenylobacterium terrae]|uniref:FAD:protein FMN transferase n=2 Tax=Phenylobacterium terrae TaxID=2665495 RepID=A0ABW4MYY3_9CAUL
MGVAWTISALVPDGLAEAEVGAAVQAAVDEVVRQMSDWEAASDLSRFNAASPGWVEVPPGLLHVVQAGLSLAEATDGAFDPTLGRLVGLWGFGPAGPAADLPADATLAGAPAGWRQVELDLAGRRIRQPGGLALDLSGIAKGYGVDQAAQALEALGVRDYLVEIGGELRGAGVKSSGEPWFVEIEPPPGFAADEPILVALHELSIATSGEWRRAVDHGGRRYGHTLDPATRRPLDNGVEQVTVLHAECMQADALCTALAVMGPVAGLAFADAEGLAALFVVREGGGLAERQSRAFAAMLD